MRTKTIDDSTHLEVSMQLWRSCEDIPHDWPPCVVTAGSFDGMHRGHVATIAAAVESARRRGTPSVVIIPSREEGNGHRTNAPPLMSLSLRIHFMDELGVDACLLAECEDYSPHPIPSQPLLDQLQIVEAVTGAQVVSGFSNHRSTSGVHYDHASTSWDRENVRVEFEIKAVPLVTAGRNDDTVVSSSYVRSCLMDGRVASAANALGRPHRIEGVVVHGEGRGTGLGFPTANVSLSAPQAIPGDGVYAAWFSVLDPSRPLPLLTGARYRAAVSVGNNPTFSGKCRTVEAFVLDVSANLYGLHVALDFVERIRGQRRFDTVEQLIAEVHRDAEKVRALLPEA